MADDEIPGDVPLGEPGGEPAEAEVPVAPARRVRLLGVPPLSRRRLLELGVEVADDPAPADLVVVSTRGAASRRAAVRRLLEAGSRVAVLCHAGGEPAAVDLMSLGASVVVAEGRERSLVDFLEGMPNARLLDYFHDTLAERTWAGGSTGLSRDAVTGLPTAPAFELRMAELGKEGVVPRIGLVELGSEETLRHVPAQVRAGVRRRLAASVAQILAAGDAEVYDLGGRLAFLTPRDRRAAAEAGAQIVALGAMFSSSGAPVDVTVGMAGPEAAADAAAARILAERALDSARLTEARVADAGDLAELASGAVELDASLRLAAAVDALDPRGSHSSTIASFAADLMREVGADTREVAEVALAAHLHDVGKITLGPVAFAGPETRHPVLGAEIVRWSAGETVAAIVRGHHERWDGSGFPDGLGGEDIPFGARALAVAHVYDDLSRSVGTGEVSAGLEAEAGAALDPDLVEVALALLGRG